MRRSDAGTTEMSPGARRGRDGFTLLELLVTIAVLAVLAAFLLPVLAQAREQARRAACLSRVQQIARAQLLYMQDWDERFPDWHISVSPEPGPFGTFRFWPQYFHLYLRTEGAYRDPVAVRPERPAAEVWLADFCLVTWGPSGFGRPDAPYFRWPGAPLSLAEVVRPTETLTLMDGLTTTGWTGRSLRHGAGGNVSFVDGHARWMADAEFFRLDSDGQGFYWMHYGTTDR
jgi:prepilin-type N-terminal cleavage/methylation domain-containing protein/prepilin-type processing-associated H-X9-DG protein